MTDEAIEYVISEVDQDNNDKICIEEFLTMMQGKYDQDIIDFDKFTQTEQNFKKKSKWAHIH